MKITPALCVRHLLAKLHPPLPKTSRESQQLLNVLESSFRRHLDDLHPSPKSTADKHEASNRHIPLSAVNSSSATHQYLQSLLSHPFLDRKFGDDAEISSLARRSVAKFDRAGATDSVSLSVLLDCCKEYLSGIKGGIHEGGNQRLGPRIAAWVTSISPELRTTFFAETQTLDRVLPVMTADNQETTVWEWLRIVYERDFGALNTFNDLGQLDVTWLSIEDKLVSTLMRFSIRRRELSDAAHQFIEACRYREISGRATVSCPSPTRTLQHVPMASSWQRLAAAILHMRKSHGISAELFSSALRYSTNWSYAPQFSEQVLMVYHPQKPSAQLLARQLGDSDGATLLLKAQSKFGKAMQRALLLALLDGAQVSLDNGFRHDAKLLLDFAGTHYHEILPVVRAQDHRSIESRLQDIHDTFRMLTFAKQQPRPI